MKRPLITTAELKKIERAYRRASREKFSLSIDFQDEMKVYKEGNSWIAAGTQYDIVAQGKTLAEAQENWAQSFAATVALLLKFNVKRHPWSGRKKYLLTFHNPIFHKPTRLRSQR